MTVSFSKCSDLTPW